jgi:hypothetical protein
VFVFACRRADLAGLVCLPAVRFGSLRWACDLVSWGPRSFIGRAPYHFPIGLDLVESFCGFDFHLLTIKDFDF